MCCSALARLKHYVTGFLHVPSAANPTHSSNSRKSTEAGSAPRTRIVFRGGINAFSSDVDTGSVKKARSRLDPELRF